MANLFLVLLLLSLLALVVGLIKPSLFNKGFKNGANRKKTSVTFIICTVVFFILFGVTSPTHKDNSATQSNNTAQTPPAVATTTAADNTPAPTTINTQPITDKPTTTPTPSKPAPTPPAPVATPTPTPPATPQVLFSASGSGTKSTQTFTVPKSWQLDWSYDCSNFGSQGNFVVSVYNADGSPSYNNTTVNQLGKSGSDTEYYHTGGTFYFEINSECSWTVKAKG